MLLTRNDFARLVGTAIAAAALCLTIPGSAAADANDNAFLRTLNTDSLLFDLPETVIQKAHIVCEAFTAGVSPADLDEKMTHTVPLTPRQTAIFMARSVQFYCPQYAERILQPS